MALKIIVTEGEIQKYPNNYELGEFIRRKYNTQLDSETKCLKCGKDKCRIDEENEGCLKKNRNREEN